MERAMIFTYNDGEFRGYAEIDFAAYESDAQQPEGLIRAGDILSESECERLGITAGTTVYCEQPSYAAPAK